MITSDEIVTAARTWIGTTFAHQGRSKKTDIASGGCDCIGLIFGVTDELGIKDRHGINLLSEHDRADYSRLPTKEKLREAFADQMLEIKPQDARPGDIMLFALNGKYPHHVGYVSDYIYGGLGIIHTSDTTDKVVEHHLSDKWINLAISAFRFYPRSLGAE